MSLNGYDISSYQGDIDNRVVPGDFVIIKATEGVGYVDPDCDANFQQALGAGKLVGFYHFGRPDGNDPISEARWFVNNTLNYFGVGVPVLDIETQPITPVWVKAFADEVYRLTQVRIWIYSFQSAFNSGDWSALWPNYAAWVAAYGANNPQNGYGNPNPPVTINGDWVIAGVQYTSQGHLPGWNANLDLDIAYLDAEHWKKYATGDRNVAPAPAPAPAPVVTPAPAVEPTVIVPAPTPAEPTTAEPTFTPAPVPVPAAPAGPGKLKSALNLITAIAGLSAVKSYLKRLFDPTTGIGRTIRGVLQTAIGLVGFIMLIVSLPQFKDFWLSQPILTGWAAPTAVVGVVTAVWNGLGAIINYYQNLSNS